MQTLTQPQTAHSLSGTAEYGAESVFDELLHYTADEYLLRERSALNKHEFVKGKVRTMAGASAKHNKITTNLLRILLRQLSSDDYGVFGSDMRIHAPSSESFLYADIAVVEGQEQLHQDIFFDTLLNPLVIIEVLSKSTSAHDRTDKFNTYKSIESVQEYVLVSQASPHIEVFTRKNRLEWLYREQFEMDSVIELISIHIPLPLREVYAKVEFGGEA